MSVNYRAGVAYGWAFSGKEFEKFNEATGWKYEDDFIILDPYYGVHCEQKAIFGKFLVKNSCLGTAHSFTLNEVNNIDMDLTEWIARFEEAGYDTSKLLPARHFIINQVY